MKRMIIGSLLFICGATTIYAQEATSDDEYRQTFDRVARRLEKPDYSNFAANLAEKYGIDNTDEKAPASEQLASTLRNTAEVTDRLTAALEKKTLEQPYNDFYLLAKDQISLEDLKKVEHLLYSDIYIRSSKQSVNFQDETSLPLLITMFSTVLSKAEKEYSIKDEKYTSALNEYKEIFIPAIKEGLSKSNKINLLSDEQINAVYLATAYTLMKYYTPDEIGQLCKMLKETQTTVNKLTSLRTNASLPYIKQISEDNIIEEAKKLTKLDMAKYYKQQASIPYCISKKRDLRDSIPFRKGYYVGDVFNTMPNGIGTYHSDKGEIIFGQWKDGKEHGAILHTPKTGSDTRWEAWQDGKVNKSAKIATSMNEKGLSQALVSFSENEHYGWGYRKTDDGYEDGYFENTIKSGKRLVKNRIQESNSFFLLGCFGKTTIETDENITVIEGIDYGLYTLGTNNHRYEISENGDTLAHYYGEMDMRNLNGYGTYTSKQKQLTGYFYEGQLINGRKIINANNALIEGDFNEDELLEGEGKIRMDGKLYEGNFKDGNLNGKGKVTYKEKDGNNAVAEGIFDNGKLINGTITKEGSDIKMLIKEKSNNPLSPNSKPIHPNFILKY